MQRHMQNISFFVIISVLLGCAFFFSQLTNLDQGESANTVTPDDDEMVDDMPACTGEMSQSEEEACYSEAVQISEKLVNDAVDRILDMEANSDERISFMDDQFDWEESRDADCSYVYGQTDDTLEAGIRESICLRDQNLERLDQLEAFYCDWFGEGDCLASSAQGE